MSNQLIVSVLVLMFVMVLRVESGEYGGGHGGGGGGIFIKTGGDGRHRMSDIILIGGHSKCHSDPTLIKTSGRHRKYSDLILFGGHNKCHEKKKTEYIPIPYPVKEQVHIPVHIPVKETVHVPVHIPMKHEDHGWDSGHMDMGGGYGGGMEHMEMDYGWKR